MIERKLLCAAGQCYAITGDGSVGAWSPDNLLQRDPAPVRCGDVAWIDGAYGVTGDKRADDAGLVGRVDEGVIIALRGTVRTFTDWFNNFDVQLSSPSHGAFPGMSHRGFRMSAVAVLNELGPAIQAAVRDADAARPAGSPAPIYVTGHSKGGAMAPFVAWWLRTAGNQPIAGPRRKVFVRTFAAPALANPDFRAAYEAVGIDHVRYECHGDLVPLLPLTGEMFRLLPPALLDLPFDGGYTPLGRLRYINARGGIATAASVGAARLVAFRDICAGVTVGVYPHAQHEIVRGSGYCRALPA